jgi:hypothetical protein
MSELTGRALLLSLTLLFLFLIGASGASAESTFAAVLTVPDVSDFPHMTAFLDVHDPAGAFVHGLTASDVTIQENNLPLPVTELEEQKPGVQFVLAITPGESFTIRDSSGISRYDYLLQGVMAGSWMDQPSGVDDLSLITKNGPQLLHSSDPAVLKSTLESYTPDDQDVSPNLEILASALQIASDPTDRSGMERAILFITPPQPSEVSLGLQSIIASAKQQDIRIYVWTVASQDVFEELEVKQLQTLAEETGAGFFTFSHDEPVPDLETILEPLRYIYQLSYNSQISSSGTQQVFAQVMVGSEQVTTDSKSFELTLQPPVPAFIDIPVEITRYYSQPPTPEESGLVTDLVPGEQVLQIKVDFPDGYDRLLNRTSLYVDGVVVTENTDPPFDTFTWDLRPYTQEGVHTLVVEAVDELGMSGKSEEKSIRVSLPDSSQGMMMEFSQKRYLLAGIIGLIAISLVILFFILGGRIRPKPHPGQVSHPAAYQARTLQRKEQAPQVIKAATIAKKQTSSPSKSWKDRLPWSRHKPVATPAIALIIPLPGSDETTLPVSMPIIADDICIGSDPLRSDLLISDQTVEGVHARIHHQGDSFIITDAGTVAGTWVNYQQVPEGGAQLEHADIIHLGEVVFRFNLAEPGSPRKIIVTPMESVQ